MLIQDCDDLLDETMQVSSKGFGIFLMLFVTDVARKLEKWQSVSIRPDLFEPSHICGQQFRDLEPGYQLPATWNVYAGNYHDLLLPTLLLPGHNTPFVIVQRRITYSNVFLSPGIWVHPGLLCVLFNKSSSGGIPCAGNASRPPEQMNQSVTPACIKEAVFNILNINLTCKQPFAL